MPNIGPKKIVPVIEAALGNIDHALDIARTSQSVRVAAVVSGTEEDRAAWEELLTASGARVFNEDGSTVVLSLLERTGKKTKEGNMLGTLLAYASIKEICASRKVPYREYVTLVGMLFGRGERLSPITQSRGNRKSAVIVSPGRKVSGLTAPGRTSIEEALFYFAPVAKYLEKRGFRGILDKWGDETEVASIDLTEMPSEKTYMDSYDVIKFVSMVGITEELARQKDWVIFDAEGRVTGQLPREPKSVLLEHLAAHGLKFSPGKRASAGVSLGPVAFSYDFLDIALDVFWDDIKTPGVVLDVDPYFLMALTMGPDREKWESKVASDPALRALAGPNGTIPDFFDKVQKLKTSFRKKHGRGINVMAMDMGPGVYWGDIGQHVSMRKKFMELNDPGGQGIIARRIAGIDQERDCRGNITINSSIAPGADLTDSVVVNSVIGPLSKVAGSVIIDSEFTHLESREAFSVRSARCGYTRLSPKSGLYGSIGTARLELDKGERHVSLLTGGMKYDLKVAENDDLRDKKNVLDTPIHGNGISFSRAYEMMSHVSMKELERRRTIAMEGLEAAKKKAARFKPLAFGTSGLRDTVENLTDMEVYINTTGFLSFLAAKGGIKNGGSVAIGGDLRPSTMRIMAAAAKAVVDSGYAPDMIGTVPSPVLACYAMANGMPSIMVTGSHIPADRNGIKFTKRSGEVLKSDEAAILANVSAAREKEYGMTDEMSLFDEKGMFKVPALLPEASNRTRAEEMYHKRYAGVFGQDSLKGLRVVVYQHSAVGRDILAGILSNLGAETILVGRSDEFLPVDTEKVSAATMEVLRRSARDYEPHAVVSMDGDSDRPLVADERGEFIPGDKLGALVSLYLKPDFAAVPVSANPAVVKALSAAGIEVRQTRIGSPFVIAAMNEKLGKDPSAKVVSWESNGGFLLGTDWVINRKKLKALPTRDAVLPILALLLLARKEEMKLSVLADTRLPRFYTASGVVDNKDEGAQDYNSEMGQKLIKMFSPTDPGVQEASYLEGDILVSGKKVSALRRKELLDIKVKLQRYLGKDKGFGEIVRVNFVDGIRVTFVTNEGREEISHIRPSGNAPEFRNYAAADTQKRADEIAALRYRIVPEMVRDLLQK
ncbi:MAG: hypothetical protein PHT95_01440 [Candidatus Omnitrophica bacterium]|nr:hypothetical protein [Candidatus Omnitrophota bacterium]MDD4012943.1 hypothetical protein [Candidatus Omnitrophota bacterium]